VGLGAIQTQVLQRLKCCWDGALQDWSRSTATTVPTALSARLADTATLVILSGDPGIGKSALVQSIANAYCKETQQPGNLYWLTTAARGDGTVGNFSRQLRAAFEVVEQAARDIPAFVLIDEGDALCMARSEKQAHQEDRAGTSSLLAIIDQLGGRKVAVFLTTNLLDRVDAAIQRRAMCYELRRPDRAARLLLLRHWFPDAAEQVLTHAARAADWMTPVDIERTIEALYLDSLANGVAPDLTTLPARLRRAPRTSAV